MEVQRHSIFPAAPWGATKAAGFTPAARLAHRHGVVAALLWPFLLVSACAVAQTEWKLPGAVDIQRSQQVVITVDPGSVTRRAAPASLFGFNVPWMNFQRGYWRGDRVRPEIIDWLRPFSGAVYRYPGGEVSNWFEWEKAVGPVATRAPQYTNFGPTKAEFGFDEFLDFVKAVHGVPLVTVNLKGTKGAAWDDSGAAASNAGWVRYSVQREGGAVAGSSSRFCQEGKNCPVEWWELGNELDWGKDAWAPGQYVKRARAVGLALKKVDPAIKLIAHTATSPWSAKRSVGATTREFDNAVGTGLGDIAYGYAYHPYYDGINVPEANRYMERAINGLATASGGAASPPIFITEHGRWPNRPAFGDWRTVWGKTGNLGGAISTADYLLTQLLIPNVRAAMWHSLGARGPWQLFYLDSDGDELYPNAVYWGLRVLRMGLLDDVLRANVSSPNTTGYGGGYDVRAVFMRASTGARYSLMTTNRSGAEQKAQLVIPDWAGRVFKARQYFVTGSSQSDANVDEIKNRVTMRDRFMAIRFDTKGRATISLPAHSVSSVVLEP